MVDFRKAFLLLALVVIATGIASAQTAPLICTANAGQPPILRGEGVAEPVGQVTIICTGGTSNVYGVTIPTINIQIFMSAPVTSRLLVSDTNYSEALLLIDEPGPATQIACEAQTSGGCPVMAVGGGQYFGGANNLRPNVFQAMQVGSNSLAWLGVPFDPPGTTPNRVLRIVNVRVNANYAGVSPGLAPTAINMFISISGTGSLTLVNPQLTVGYVQYGLGFSADTLTLNQCEPQTDRALNMKLKELFGTAFLPLYQPPATAPGAQDQPGVIYNTEHMFWKNGNWNVYGGGTGSKLTSAAGQATQATRFIIRYANVPANVSLKVPTSASSTGVAAALCSGCSGSTTGSDGKITLTGGAGASVYEITAADPAQISTLTIPLLITYTASALPGLGTATVTGNYAPTTTVFAASVSAPVPRFVDNPQSATTFTINPCRTNLLFPFVTNAAGWDTGIAISNTSADPFGTVTQTGPCTLNYYGKNPPAGGLQGPTAAIAPGDTMVFLVSAGGTHNVVATPAFQGYMIAQCNFQYAHGFAFISDLGANRLAEGYLALVMDKNMFGSGDTRSKASSEVLAH